MTKEDILEYVSHTPHNTNPNMIGNMIDALIAQGGGGGGTEPIKIYFDPSTPISPGRLAFMGYLDSEMTHQYQAEDIIPQDCQYIVFGVAGGTVVMTLFPSLLYLDPTATDALRVIVPSDQGPTFWEIVLRSNK